MITLKLGFVKCIISQTFNAHKIIRPKDELFTVEQGIVEIWHSRHDMLVTKLEAETLFGDMPLLGQSMYGCQAIAGSGGVTLGLVSPNRVYGWLKEEPRKILEEIGPRLIRIETEHYRVGFQTTDARLAALLLELTGESSMVAGYGHEELSQRLVTCFPKFGPSIVRQSLQCNTGAIDEEEPFQ